ncbi:MAG TPA: DUF2461 domain-containing protein [Chitinophagaceae bacterium]|nr:DUF2461 domain-containing protein [Chitinophagaceae bacterium]
MLQPATIKFLKDLKKNNNKEWFDANRKIYEVAKNDFENLVQTVIEIYCKKDNELTSLKAKDCMFRINRDIRFSKDKSPYKTNFGASINKGGRKSILAGYYFHCEPSESFVGGGLWMPMPEELKKIRQEIDYCFEEFKKIINNKKFKTFYGELYKGEDMTLSRPPKGYDENNPAIGFIKLKSFIAMQQLNEADLTDKNLAKKITGAFEALQPMVKFINRALEG